jgi:hypothetical protein
MPTYKFSALDTGGKQTEGALAAESSQEALRKVKEQGLLPVAIELISAPIDVPPSASIPPHAEHGVMKLYAFGWKIRLCKLLVFHLPFCLVAGIGFFLFFQGKPTWLVFIIAVGGLIAFGITGMIVEQKMLDAFVCPRCKTPNEDWDRDAKYRIFYDCPQCGIRWDIGYKLKPGRRAGT